MAEAVAGAAEEMVLQARHEGPNQTTTQTCPLYGKSCLVHPCRLCSRQINRLVARCKGKLESY